MIGSWWKAAVSVCLALAITCAGLSVPALADGPDDVTSALADAGDLIVPERALEPTDAGFAAVGAGDEVQIPRDAAGMRTLAITHTYPATELADAADGVIDHLDRLTTDLVARMIG